MSTYSDEHKEFLKALTKNKILISFFRILIISVFLIGWEVLARYKIINTFLFSSPSNVVNTTIQLISEGELFRHIAITVYEVLISFFISSIIGIIVATILWSNSTVAKVIDPYLTILNSLPKVALGPLIIIWVGASINSIIFMALLISTFVTIINIYSGFTSTDRCYITLLKSLGANKKQIFLKVIWPSNLNIIINTFKMNISMCLIGVIMGELLVSKSGLGYLIMYGSQVFNIDLVITGVMFLGLISYLMYFAVARIELYLVNRAN